MKDDAVEAEISETQEDPTVPEIEQVAQATSRKLLILIGVAAALFIIMQATPLGAQIRDWETITEIVKAGGWKADLYFVLISSALILIGMPGLEKQFSHYPQFYSRVGFAHQYRPLGQDELLFVLERHWRSLGKTLDPDDFTDAQAIAAIARITRGNFRLLERLFPQIARVLKINGLETITADVIEAAASILVIGN